MFAELLSDPASVLFNSRLSHVVKAGMSRNPAERPRAAELYTWLTVTARMEAVARGVASLAPLVVGCVTRCAVSLGSFSARIIFFQIQSVTLRPGIHLDVYRVLRPARKAFRAETRGR